MPNAAVRQLINGICFDYSSIELSVFGGIFTEVTSIDYNHSLNPGVLRGTSAKKLGRSRGQYEADGALQFGLQAWHEFLALILSKNPTQGYMEVAFPISVTYAELGGAPIIDTLVGARITNASKSHAAGSDVLTVSCTLDIMEVMEGGIRAVGPVLSP